MSVPYEVELETGRLRVRVFDGHFALQDLCGFAARNNPRRGFLFLSKVLGKHWPARPSQMREVHRALASRLDLGPGPWLFVAMAETATGLGQGVFEAVLEQRPDAPALFIHSTRYHLAGRPFLEFEEPHCHAPDQSLYAPLDPAHLNIFRTARELVLVDDEVSTGATLCNLVAAYRACNPRLERVHFTAITDFSGAGSAERFAARLDLPVRCVAALRGEFDFAPALREVAGRGIYPVPNEPAPRAVGDNRCEPGQVADDLGRFGIDRPVRIPAPDIARLCHGLAPGASILVLGTGEFMHSAFRVGLALEERGFDVVVQATTRSPILLGADVRRRLQFADNYGEGIPNYLYNVDPERFARILVCHETPADALEDLVRQLGPRCMTYRFAGTQGEPLSPTPLPAGERGSGRDRLSRDGTVT